MTVDTIAACLTSSLHCPAAAALIETSRDILINAAPPVTPPSQAGDTGVQTGGSSSHRISPALTWLLLLRSPMGIFRYYCHSSPFLHTPHPVHASSIPPQPENVGGRKQGVDTAQLSYEILNLNQQNFETECIKPLLCKTSMKI